MKFLTAVEAKQISDKAAKYKHLGTTLTQTLDSILESATRGKTEYLSQGWGPAADFDGLKAALIDLGYTVQDISNKPMPGGAMYMDRSLKITW